jgi:hypothetical protein
MSVIDGVVGAAVTGALGAVGYFWKRRRDRRAAVAGEELKWMESFHDTAYKLQIRLEQVAKTIAGRPAEDLTDEKRDTYLNELSGMVSDVRYQWDKATNSTDSFELHQALDGVWATVERDISNPLYEGKLTPDPASLRGALEAFREIANRRVGTRFKLQKSTV